MALIAVSSGIQARHISKTDPAQTEEAGATVFLLGTISAREQALIKDAAFTWQPDPNDADKMVSVHHGNLAAIETVKFGLQGILNFQDASGNPVPFTTEVRVIDGKDRTVATDAMTDALGLQLVREIADKLSDLNTVTAAAAKN